MRCGKGNSEWDIHTVWLLSDETEHVQGCCLTRASYRLWQKVERVTVMMVLYIGESGDFSKIENRMTWQKILTMNKRASFLSIKSILSFRLVWLPWNWSLKKSFRNIEGAYFHQKFKKIFFLSNWKLKKVWMKFQFYYSND